MNKEEKIQEALKLFQSKCDKLPKDEDFVSKLIKHEEFIITSILEVILDK